VSWIGIMDLAEMINLDIHEEDDDLDVLEFLENEFLDKFTKEIIISILR
jgi:hypothetical protein